MGKHARLGPPDAGKTPNPHKAPSRDHSARSGRAAAHGLSRARCAGLGWSPGSAAPPPCGQGPPPAWPAVPSHAGPGGRAAFARPSRQAPHTLESTPSRAHTYLTRGPTGSTLTAQMRHRPAEETRGHTSSSVLNPEQPRAREGSANTQQSPGTREAGRAFAQSGPAGSPGPWRAGTERWLMAPLWGPRSTPPNTLASPATSTAHAHVSDER